MFTKWILSTIFLASLPLSALEDPHQLLPKINSYIQQEFHQAFATDMTYDYNSVTCRESHCDKFHMIMKISPLRSGRVVVDMLDEDGKSFGARTLSKAEWDLKGKSVFHLSLHQQMNKYSEIRIDSMKNIELFRSINGQTRRIEAKEVAIFLKKGAEVTNKVFTISNQLPGYASVLKIHDKQQKPVFKNIDRKIDHIFY